MTLVFRPPGEVGAIFISADDLEARARYRNVTAVVENPGLSQFRKPFNSLVPRYRSIENIDTQAPQHLRQLVQHRLVDMRSDEIAAPTFHPRHVEAVKATNSSRTIRRPHPAG